MASNVHVVHLLILDKGRDFFYHVLENIFYWSLLFILLIHISSVLCRGVFKQIKDAMFYCHGCKLFKTKLFNLSLLAGPSLEIGSYI